MFPFSPFPLNESITGDGVKLPNLFSLPYHSKRESERFEKSLKPLFEALVIAYIIRQITNFVKVKQGLFEPVPVLLLDVLR